MTARYIEFLMSVSFPYFDPFWESVCTNALANEPPESGPVWRVMEKIIDAKIN